MKTETVGIIFLRLLSDPANKNAPSLARISSTALSTSLSFFKSASASHPPHSRKTSHSRRLLQELRPPMPQFSHPPASFIHETCIRLHINVGVGIVNERRRRCRHRRRRDAQPPSPLPKLAKAQFTPRRDERKCICCPPSRCLPLRTYVK